MKVCGAHRGTELKEERNKGGSARKEEKSRISSRRSLFRGCDYRCLLDSRVSTRSTVVGRRSHHAHQFALRYKLGDRLYPDYGVTRYRARFPICAVAHMTTLTPLLSSTALLLMDRACAWVKCTYVTRIYVCIKHTARTGRGRVIIIRKASHSFSELHNVSRPPL